MTIQRFAVVLGLLSLTACTVPVAPVAVQPLPPVVVPPVQPVTPSVDRAAAVSIITRSFARQPSLNGINVSPYASCVVNNATEAELADIATMGDNNAGANLAIASIVKRPSTSSCIAGLSRTA